MLFRSGVDADLVVKPFGWKGTAADFADFASEALQVHIGIQSDVLLASASRDVLGDGNDPTDPDGDGVRHELGRGPFAAMMAHLALLEMPIVELYGFTDGLISDVDVFYKDTKTIAHLAQG